MVLTKLMVTESPLVCTQRCTQFLLSLASLLRLSSRSHGAFNEPQLLHGNDAAIRKGPKPTDVISPQIQTQGSVFHGPTTSSSPGTRRSRSRRKLRRNFTGSSEIESDSTQHSSSSTNDTRNERSWDARLRDSRVNGADLYVVRVTKKGMGCAKPCWRCLEWCKWAGVKRIFHWDEDDRSFRCVKVNDPGTEPYETQADNRLAAGREWLR